MQYCDKGAESDVRLSRTPGGWVRCEACELRRDGLAAVLPGACEATSHLVEHAARGHRVPDEVYRRLADDPLVRPM